MRGERVLSPTVKVHFCLTSAFYLKFQKHQDTLQKETHIWVDIQLHLKLRIENLISWDRTRLYENKSHSARNKPPNWLNERQQQTGKPWFTSKWKLEQLQDILYSLIWGDTSMICIYHNNAYIYSLKWLGRGEWVHDWVTRDDPSFELPAWTQFVFPVL